MSGASPRILTRPEHTLSRKNIDSTALRVLHRLDRSGYRACLVGGSVRDLLLGRTPKDFDVATDASPNQIKKLFRNSRIIGRRFRLAHVFFREGIVEVATFRRNPDPETQRSAPDELLITDDNVFGTPREDAFRRDFTVNALFYNIGDFSVIDYVNGTDDLKHRVIRVIGDPDVRFAEDPIRMTRACELAARLGFTIEAETQKGIRRQAGELLKASTARLTEEITQMLRCGHSGTAMQWMMELGMSDVILPEATAILEAGKQGLGDYSKSLALLDRKVGNGEELSEIGLLSSLLLPCALLSCSEAERGRDYLPEGKVRECIAAAIDPFFRRFTLSRLKAEQVVQTIIGFRQLRRRKWTTQERVRFSHRPFFDDALLLYEIAVEAVGEGRDELKRWRRVAHARPPKPARKAAREGRPPRRRRRRKRARGRADR